MLRSIAIQATVFFVIFQLLSWFKESDMLSTDTDLTHYQFVLPTTVGETVSLSPKQTTVVYFFAPWCTVCHASIDNLQKIYQENEQIDVIAVALDYMDRADIDEFASTHSLTFPIAFGNEEVKKAYQIRAYPSYYIVNEDNIVLSKSMGYSTELGLFLRTL